MALNKTSLERQLKSAKSVLAVQAKKLAEQGVDAETRKRDPKWRRLAANCASIESRMKAADARTAIGQDLLQRKAEKAAAEAAPEVEEVKEKKPKKEKSEKAEKKTAEKKKKKEEAAEEE